MSALCIHAYYDNSSHSVIGEEAAVPWVACLQQINSGAGNTFYFVSGVQGIDRTCTLPLSNHRSNGM